MKTMITYDPLEMLDALFAGDDSYSFDARVPAIDVRENEKGYLIEAELPGVSEKDLELSLKNGVLSLSTNEGKTDGEDKDGTHYLVRERRSFSFRRSFTLPEDADEDSVNAEFRNGVLTITIAKRPEKAPKLIDVKAA